MHGGRGRENKTSAEQLQVNSQKTNDSRKIEEKTMEKDDTGSQDSKKKLMNQSESNANHDEHGSNNNVNEMKTE